MTEQERNVLLNELRQQEGQREKQIKRERFRRLNPYAKKGAVVFAGSSLMEQFPLYEFLQDDDLHCTLYNRGIGRREPRRDGVYQQHAPAAGGHGRVHP